MRVPIANGTRQRGSWSSFCLSIIEGWSSAQLYVGERIHAFVGEAHHRNTKLQTNPQLAERGLAVHWQSAGLSRDRATLTTHWLLLH